MANASATADVAGTFQAIDLPRDSGTYADVFAAVGLADLLSEATADRRVKIVNRGTTFRVELSRSRRFDDLRGVRHRAGYKYLQARSSAKPPAKVTEAVDYQDYRDRIKILREQEQELFNAARRERGKVDPEAIQALRDQWPMPPREWRRFPALLVLQGHETSNKIHAKIAELDSSAFRDTVIRAIEALANGQPSNVTWPVSTVQIFAPLAAKGYARLKPDSVGRNDKTKDAWADPFVEWLRYRGYFLSALPVFFGSKAEHIRLLCPVPGEVSIAAYRDVVSELGSPPRGAGPPKIDILATLSLSRLLIEHSEMYRRPGLRPDEQLEIRGRTPADLISGVAATNFQSLGSARAVSSLTEVALPGWFPVTSAADADEWLAILQDHEYIVRGLEDNHSDEFALLQQYRRFLERRNDSALHALLDFAGAYGTFVVRAREAKRRVRQFQTDLFRRVVIAMNSNYAAILDDDGFRAVAAAVRRATVSAQTLKARGEDHREIRYGLLPELRRARELPTNAPFMTAVAEFISLYNAENARRREMRHQAPANVTTEQMLSFTRLVDEHDASVVGALLCAYGTCTERRETMSVDDAAETADSGDVTADVEAASAETD